MYDHHQPSAGQGWRAPSACRAAAIRVAAASLTALLLASCGTVSQLTDDTRTGFRPDGGYVLSETERNLDCTRLAQHAAWHMNRMQALAAKEKGERAAPSPTMVKAVTRLFRSKDKESEHIRQYRREFAVVSAMNVALVDKGCKTVDVAARLQEDAELLGVPVRN